MPRKTENRLERFEPWLVVALLLLFLGMRLFALAADAPHYISGIGTSLDDPYWAQNARSKVLFGNWAPGEARAMVLTPFTNLLSYISFEMFGVGFAQFHLPNVIASVLTALLTYSIIRKQYGIVSGVLGLAFIGLDYVFLMHNRMGRPETINAFLMTLNIFAWQRFVWTKKPIWAFGFGLVWLLPLVGKLNDVYWVVVVASLIVLAVSTLRGEQRRELINIKSSLAFVAGSLLVAGVVSLWLIPNFAYYIHAVLGFGNRVSMGVSSTVLELYTVFFQNTFFLRMPVAVTLFFLGLARLVMEMRNAIGDREFENVDSIAVFCSLWVFFEFVSLPLYHVEAYRFVSFVPPMVILSGKAIQWILQDAPGGALATLLDRKNRYLVVLWIFPTALLLSAQAFPALLGPQWLWRITPSSVLESGCISILVATVAVAMALLGGRMFARRAAVRADLFDRTGGLLAGVLILLSVTTDLGQYFGWASSRTYTQYDVSRSLRALGDSRVIGGWAVSLDLENRIRPIVPDDRLATPFSAVAGMRDVKHLLVGSSEELGDTSVAPPMQRLIDLRHAKVTQSFVVREYLVRQYTAGD